MGVEWEVDVSVAALPKSWPKGSKMTREAHCEATNADNSEDTKQGVGSEALADNVACEGEGVVDEFSERDHFVNRSP